MGDAKKATKYYRDVEEVLCMRPDGVAKVTGKPYKILRGKTLSGKLLTIVPKRDGIAVVVITEVSDKPFAP